MEHVGNSKSNTQKQDKYYKENATNARELPLAIMPISNKEERKNKSEYIHIVPTLVYKTSLSRCKTLLTKSLI